MTFRTPPRFATWLMKKLHLPEMNPPLMGDLMEEFQSGRSRLWYWRQTLTALATCWLRGAIISRADLAAIFIGWGAQAAAVYELWTHHLRPAGSLYVALILTILAVVVFYRLLPRRIRNRVKHSLLRRLLFPAFDAIEWMFPEPVAQPAVMALSFFGGFLSAWFVASWMFDSGYMLLAVELGWLVTTMYRAVRQAALD